MTGPELDLTKRRLLAVSGASLFGTVGAGQALSGEVSYERRTVVEHGPVALEVGWTEWYNGSVREAHASQTADATAGQPVVTLADLTPGDTGTVSFGLTTASDGSSAPAVRLQTRVRELPRSGAENAITEPEAKAGDRSPDRGELGEVLDVQLWYDTGLSVEGTTVLGHCDGTFDGSIDAELTHGPLSVVAQPASSADWIALDAAPNGSSDCLESNEALCLGLNWELPADTGNRLQTDGVAFAVEFRAVPCRQGNV